MKNWNLKYSRGKTHSGGENVWEALVQKVTVAWNLSKRTILQLTIQLL